MKISEYGRVEKADMNDLLLIETADGTKTIRVIDLLMGLYKDQDGDICERNEEAET